MESIATTRRRHEISSKSENQCDITENQADESDSDSNQANTPAARR